MGHVEHALLILTPRPWKWLGVLLVCTLFVCAGWWMSQHAVEVFRRGVGWFCMVFFGMGIVIAAMQLIPGRSRTVITERGLFIKAIFTSTFIPWQEIERFGVAEWTQWHGPFRQRHRQVGIMFMTGSKHLSKQKRLKEFTTALVGYHGSLPDNYGYSCADLANILNEYLASFRAKVPYE